MVIAAVDYGQGIEEAWAKVTTFVPKFLAFLIILIIGYFVAKAIGKVFDQVLERVGFDRAVERGGIERALANSQYDASSLISRSCSTPCSCSCCRWPVASSAPTR